MIKFKVTLIAWLFITIIFLITESIGVSLVNAFRFGGLYDWNGQIGEWWRLITYGFIHSSLSHFIGNLGIGIVVMLYFENKTDSLTTILIFISGIIIGGIGFLLFNTEVRTITLGSSAGIWALLGAAAINLLLNEKLNLIEFLMVFNLTILLVYNSTVATNINNISHYCGYLSGITNLLVLKIMYNRKRMVCNET